MEKMILGIVRNQNRATIEDAWIEDVFEADDDNLSSWEIINPSEDDNDDDEEDEDYSYDEDGDLYVLESSSSDLSTRSSPHDITDHTIDLTVDVRDVKDESTDEPGVYDDYNGDDDDDGNEEEDDGYEYDVDDELVPKSVSDRFGRQRLKKLGKRASPKMNKSKRLPYYYYNRPGCVHGKQGLGLRHIIN